MRSLQGRDAAVQAQGTARLQALAGYQLCTECLDNRVDCGITRPAHRETRESGPRGPLSGAARGVIGRSSGAVSDEAIVLLSDDAPIAELDELRPLIAEGQERGF